MRFYLPVNTNLEPPLVRQEDGSTALALPPMFCPLGPGGRPMRTLVPCKPGSACFAWEGRFYIVAPGDHVDIPEPVQAERVLALCPALTTVPPTPATPAAPEPAPAPPAPVAAPAPAPEPEPTEDASGKKRR